MWKSLFILPFYHQISQDVNIFFLFSYIYAIAKLLKGKTPHNEGSDSGVELEISSNGKTKTLTPNDSNNDDQALQLHSMQTSSESFLQMVIQIYFLVLLVVMGGATLIAGREAEEYFNDICKKRIF